MHEHDIDIPTADGAMNSFVVHPEEGAPFPVALFYMDAPGKRQELHDMARRTSARGGRDCGEVLIRASRPVAMLGLPLCHRSLP
jgi:hypothetical protein